MQLDIHGIYFWAKMVFGPWLKWLNSSKTEVRVAMKFCDCRAFCDRTLKTKSDTNFANWRDEIWAAGAGRMRFGSD